MGPDHFGRRLLCNSATSGDWYLIERDRLLTSMAPLLGDVEAAHAVVEETFGRALRRRRAFATSPEARAWLYGVARQRARATRRRRRLLRRVTAAAGWRAVVPAEHFEIWRSVLRLAPEVREVVVLLAVAGLSDAAVGRSVGIPLVAVHANLWTGLRHIEAVQREPAEALRGLGAAGVVPDIPGVVAEQARARRSRRKTLVAMTVLLMIVVCVPPWLVFQGRVLGTLPALHGVRVMQSASQFTVRSVTVRAPRVIHRVVLW